MNTTYNEKIQALKDVLDNLSDTEKLFVYREYCDELNTDDQIYPTEELNDILREEKPLDIILLAISGDFFSSAEYFRFNGYGNIQSIAASELSDYINTIEISKYIVDSADGIFTTTMRNMFTTIAELLNEWDDEDDEEEDDNTGWWHVNFELTLNGKEVRWEDLSECTQEHIADMIKEGYVDGEIVE